MTAEELELFRELVEELAPEALFADGFDGAILGLGYRTGQPTLVYDAKVCVDILMERDGMTMEEAEDYFNFNVADAWVGEHTPMFVHPILRPL